MSRPVREIRFKGKRIDNGEWVYGFFIIEPPSKYSSACVSKIYIPVGEGHGKFEVFPESVCQFTGLRDRHKNEIYECDIIHIVKDRFELSSGEKHDEIWSVEYGYFGDPYVLYVHNHINSGRIVVSDIDELYYVDEDTNVMTDIPHFTKNGKDKTELIVVGNTNDKEILR
jgi:hypothetical protein